MLQHKSTTMTTSMDVDASTASVEESALSILVHRPCHSVEDEPSTRTPCASASATTTMKRKRHQQRRSVLMLLPPACVVFALIATISASVLCSDAFPVMPNPSKKTRVLAATKSPPTTTDAAHPVKPRPATSQKQRDKAVRAMMETTQQQQQMFDVDLDDSNFLGRLVSEPQILHPESGRRRGRPNYVPGAMRRDTLKKFREGMDPNDISESGDDEGDVGPWKSSSTRGQSKGSSSTTEARSEDLPEVGQGEKPGAKKRKRVVKKNLPKPRDPSEPRRVPRLKSKGNHVDLQEFFNIELLTPQEEYSLGVKIQLTMKCENVHEGLALRQSKLPSIKEWAAACGYTDKEENFQETEEMESIRPAGSEDMFKKTDPNMFVGNTLAGLAGPGRGRGRVKKVPPITLKNFYVGAEGSTAGSIKKGKIPLNRGTPSDFVKMMKEGGEAKQIMVQSNMRLVVSIAKKYCKVGVGLLDLVQEGSLGLSRAAEKYDPSRGFKFSTYASWWIQQAVFRSLAYHSRTIRLPVHIHNLLNRVRKVRATLERGLGRVPTNEEMANALGMNVSKYNKMLRLTRKSISLDLPKYQSNPKDLGHESEDLIVDSISTVNFGGEMTAEKHVDRSLFHEDLHEILEILDPNEREVIRYRYGLADGLTRTVTTVAAEMKQSKAWVRSHECKALRKLRRPWYEKKLREHQEALSS